MSLDNNKKDRYEDVIVLHPKPVYNLHNSVEVLDYCSLYPSSIISKNLSHDTFEDDLSYKSDMLLKREFNLECDKEKNNKRRISRRTTNKLN